METKSAKDKFWKSHLEYLNTRPLLQQASSDLDSDWMKMIIDEQETMDPDKLSLTNKSDLPTKRNILVLFHFFRNNNKQSTKPQIAEKVVDEINKYWLRSNIPTQTKFWIKKGISSLNSSYEKLFKHIKLDSETESSKRDKFVTSLAKLFDIFMIYLYHDYTTI